jgi:hypothetical protein
MGRIAITQVITFHARVASFHPIDKNNLISEFSKWVVEHGRENGFITSDVSFNLNEKEGEQL